MNDLQCEAIQDEECEEVNINLDNDCHHDHDANDDNHGNNNGDQQMNIVGQFSHSQVEEEDCSGVAADSGAVCGDFHFFPFFLNLFIFSYFLGR